MKEEILLYIKSAHSWLEKRLAEIESEKNSSSEWKQIEIKCAYQTAYEGLISDIKGELNEK